MTTTLTIIVILAMLWLAWPRTPKRVYRLDETTYYDSTRRDHEQEYAYFITSRGTQKVPVKWKVSHPQPRITIKGNP